MRELWKLNPYIAKYPYLLFGGIVFILFTNVFAVYAPSLIGEGVNAMKAVDETFLAPMRDGQPEVLVFRDAPAPETPRTLQFIEEWFGVTGEGWMQSFQGKSDALAWMKRLAFWQAGLFLLAYLIKGVFLFFTRQTIIVMSRRIEFDLKGILFDQYQRLDASFYKANDTGDLMNRISEDVSKVRMYLGPAIMYSLNLAVLIILVVSVMVYIDWQLTLFALLPLPLMSVGIYFVSSRINRQSESVQRLQSSLSTFVQQHIAGIRVLKSFQREKDAAQRFTVEADAYKNSALDLVKTEALYAHHRVTGRAEHHFDHLHRWPTRHRWGAGSWSHFPVCVLRQPFDLAVCKRWMGDFFGPESRSIHGANQRLHGVRPADPIARTAINVRCGTHVLGI